MTPEQVHYGLVEVIYRSLNEVLQGAFEKSPMRFKGKMPVPPQLPQAA